MPPDKKLIERKISLIREDLDDFEQIARKPKREFLQDRLGQLATERYLERIIGRMIDINYHIITGSGHPAPADYYQSFIRLGEIKAIKDETAAKMAKFAGLRNVLAHEYNGIDETLVWKGMQELLKLLPGYLKQVENYGREN